MHARDEIARLHDQHIAGEVIDDPFRCIADEEPLQAGARDRAHHDDVAARVSDDYWNRIGGMGAHEMAPASGDGNLFENPVESGTCVSTRSRLEFPGGVPGKQFPSLYVGGHRHEGVDDMQGALECATDSARRRQNLGSPSGVERRAGLERRTGKDRRSR